MKTRSSIITGLLLSAMVAWSTIAIAATPASDTLSENNMLVSWTGHPQPPTASATCGGPDNPACDNFQLSIVPPSYAFSVAITLTAGPADDYDLEVYDPAGQLVASSGNSPGSAESVALSNPAAGTYTVSASNYAAVLAYDATAELVAEDPAPPLGNENISFALYPAPDGLGTNAGEPSIGVNWNTDRVMYIAGLQTLQVTFDDCSSPASAEWEDVSFPLTGTVTLDPILFTDSQTGRTFASQLAGLCSAMAFTDSDGRSWTPSQGCGINSGVDHQTIGGGPFAAPLTRDPNDPLLYPNAVYYCSQDIAVAQCARSDTGGLTFLEATPIYNITECGGLHGHVKVAPDDGTVYVPNKSCNGEQGVAVSDQNGLLGTWQVRRVPGTTSGEWDPSVGIGADGTVYIGMTNSGRPMAAVSTDKGLTWSDPLDVGVGVGPNGFDILNTAFPVVVAGDGDRAAFAFLGAEQGGDGGGEDPDSGHLWYPYVSVTYDRGVTWTTVNLSPNDPVQRGTVCSSGTTCGGTRNLLDFTDITVDREGRVLFGFADGCIGDCAKQGPNSASELATIARQKGGKRLFAAYDGPDLPLAPQVEVGFVDGDETRVGITWQEPDDRGLTIYEYRIYRRFEGSNTAELLAAVDGDTRSYEDTISENDPTVFYRVTAVNSFGEGPSCSWLPPNVEATPESPCLEPGLTILSDASGDQTVPDDAYDVEYLAISQPIDLDPELIVFTLKVADLASPPVNSTWPVSFLGADGNPYFVKMATNLLGTVSFAVGQGTNVTAAGSPANGASSFNADGTIRIVVPRSAIGNPQNGDVLSSFLVRVRLELALGSGLTPDNMPDGLTPTGSYQLASCAGVEYCAQAAVSDPLHGGQADHAFWMPGIGRDFIFLSDGAFLEWPDGTARLTGTLVDKFDQQKRFQVDVAFSDYTDVPPAGSPKKELKHGAYVENGGPVDPATWHYYETFVGILSGEQSYDGARVQIFRRGAAFQVGDGANGRNGLFGGSGWLNYQTEQQPTTGSLPDGGHGDMNLTLECQE